MAPVDADARTLRALLTRPLVLRFRWRSLFLIFTAISVWLGWRVVQVHRRRAVVQLVHKYGETVIYDFNDKNRGARPRGWKGSVASLFGDEFVYTVVGVSLTGRTINDDAVAAISPHLARLGGLQWLILIM